MIKTQLNQIQIHADELRRQTQFARLCEQLGEFAGCAFAAARRCELEAQGGKDFCGMVFVPTRAKAGYGRLHAPAEHLPTVVELIRLLMPGCTVTVLPEKNNEVPLTVSWADAPGVEER